MRKVTLQQRLNALKALELWAAVPPEAVVPDLGVWRCGTQACFGGHLATWPYFKAQGVKESLHGAPASAKYSGFYASFVIARDLFGCQYVFEMRGGCASDQIAPAGYTDHELVTHRLQYLIDNSEVV